MSRIVVLTGGVGGAKLVQGLAAAIPASDVTAIVNTGDDFRHLGLWVSPDIDTLLYTLADKNNVEQGWGRRDETWTFMQALKSLGGEDWFLLGDGDLALHIERTRRLNAGENLSAIVAGFARAWGIASEILPMSDDAVATMVDTDEGELEFQRYFVERRCAPRLRSVRFRGAAEASRTEAALQRLHDPDTSAIVIAPSNPYLSIDPILAVGGMREALRAASAPVVAVSPLIGGQAVKGPTRKIMDELGVLATPSAIAQHYAGVIDGLLIDERDAGEPPPAIAFAHADTLMKTLPDKVRVAEAALSLARTIGR